MSRLPNSWLRPLALALALGLVLASSSALRAQVGGPAEPAGYRNSEYRAPVPATLNGARVVSTQEAEALWRDKAAIFVDVLPRPVKPATLPEGTVWRDKPRYDIPGSIWLPNVGYGALAPEMDQYYRKGLLEAVGGDLALPIVIYCQAECWMSWNAAKRALEYGHTHVIWYPQGTDGWQQDSPVALEERAPVPLPE